MDKHQFALPHEVGLDEKRLDNAYEILRRSVNDRHIPGYVAAVGRKGKIVFLEAHGYASVLPNKRPMHNNTVFDIASVTKVVATSTAIMMLVEKGIICLNEPVSKYIPSFTGGYKTIITIRHLLTHTSGLISQPEYHHDYSQKETLLKSIISTPLIFEPGSAFNYTCIGFHLLGEIIQIVTGTRMDEYVNEQIFLPLAMYNTSFLPNETLAKKAASTEYCKWRKIIVQGRVHDENCSVLGGVSGNAGLFTTALDLCKYSIMLLKGGKSNGNILMSRKTIELMWRNSTPHLVQSWGLGWAIDNHAFGDLLPGNVGHTGFTGCSLCLCPEEMLFVVLLTNRVHFGRENDCIKQIRPRFHNAIAASIIN